MTRPTVRYEDYTLDDTQEALRDAVRRFFANECPPEVVRAAEPTGFDPDLWASFAEIGSSLVDATGTGEGATLVDLALVAEEVGRVAAPIPFVSDVVARRLAVRGHTPADDPGPWTLALEPMTRGVAQLVPDVTAASTVLALEGDRVVRCTTDGARHVANLGSTPLGWWEPGEPAAELTGCGDARAAHERARREWKLLDAAALIGLTDAALALAVQAVTDRRTMGVPLGALQGVAFPLADVAIGVTSARHLVWRAAWFEEHEPETHPDLVPLAHAWACRVATDGTAAAAHFHGGLGFTVEADVARYFLRAKGWSLVGGDPTRDLVAVGARLVGRS